MNKDQLKQAFDEAVRLGEYEDAYAIEQQMNAIAQPVETPAPESPDYRSMNLNAMRGGPGREFSAIAEPAMTVASSATAEPLAGLAGLYGVVTGDAARGTELIEGVRESLTYDPKTEEGKAGLQAVAEKLTPFANWVQGIEQATGDAGYAAGGPLGGAIGTVLPAAVLEVLGLGMARKAKNTAKTAQRISEATPDARSAQLLEAGERFDVPVLTTDVRPPSSFMGRWGQSLSEKLGPLGSGTARASQQQAREAAVRGFAEQFDIELESPFADGMVKSLSRKRADELRVAGEQRARSIDALVPYGRVPMENTKTTIARLIAKEKAKKKKANTELIGTLEDTLESLDGDFSHIRDIRTEAIADVRDAKAGNNARAYGALQQVKTAMDRDMVKFAAQHDKAAMDDWIKSNRSFGDAYMRTKDTELKRILNAGEATPEKIMPFIRGGKRSELERIYRSLDDAGRESARRAILQDALKDAKFFEVDQNPNPDAFATALNKANRQQAIRVFFDGQSRAEIDGLARLLQATRRAQSGQTVLKTGEQNMLMILGAATGVGTYTAPGVVIPAVTVGSALAKAYESTAFRNLLLKLSNTQPGSKAETGLLESAAAFAVAELRAAKTEPEEKQQ